jgi:hypothetical protein
MSDLLKAYGVRIIETDEEAAALLDRHWLDVHPYVSLAVLTAGVATMAVVALWGAL